MEKEIKQEVIFLENNDYEYIVDSIKNNDENLKDYVSELLNLNWIENNSAAEGVAKVFVNIGSDNLSNKQIHTLARHGILPHFSVCHICGDADWNQMSFIQDQDVCSWCDNLLSE